MLQGSMLSPFLFRVVIDLIQLARESVMWYADDLALMSKTTESPLF